MKKMFMMALAVLAISFASCTNGASESTTDTTDNDTIVAEEVVDTLDVVDTDTVVVVEEEVAL